VVTIANHGAEAVKRLKEGPEVPEFEVVLMDLQMPVMDGHTATRLLRADSRFKDLPIIAMTAHALVEERQRCLEAGMNDHVTKPIDPDALFAALKRWARPRAQAAATPGEKPVEKPAPVTSDVILPAIEGIDIEGGLKRVAGNKRLLRSLLEQFAQKQADAGSQIAEALRNQDYELASRIAHTVKGVAGNLGIGAIQAAAEKIERGIREKDQTVSGLLPEFEAALASMSQRIGRALADSAPAAPAVESPREFNAQAAAAALARVRTLIEANDGDAATALSDLESAVGSAVDRTALDALRSALDEFDFDRALSKLDEVAGRCMAAKG